MEMTQLWKVQFLLTILVLLFSGDYQLSVISLSNF